MRDSMPYRSRLAIFLGYAAAACGSSEPGGLVPPAPAPVDVIGTPGRESTESGGSSDPLVSAQPAPAQPPVVGSEPEGEEPPLPAGDGFGHLLPGLGEAELCAELQRDRSEENEIALNRLELLFSRARIEGSVGQPVATDGYYFAAPIDVERVWFGPSFVEGAQTYLALSPEQAESFVPGRYLIGMGSPFPGREPETRAPMWLNVQALIPVAEREPYADLFAFTVQAPASVAVVEIAARDSYFVTFRVIEPLAGELPDELTDIWETEISDVAFPPVSSTRYLATFRSVFPNEGTERYSGILSDLRPYDDATRESAIQALAAPIRAFNAAGLLGMDADYQMAWTVHRAPSVVATRIGGAAHECCTGAGGTYFSHDVTHEIRSSGAVRLLLGGHGYYSEERCGERQLLALNATGALPYAEPQEFGCGEPSSWPSILDSYLPSAEVHVQVPDSELARSKFEQWVQAPDPVYLLRGESELAEPAALGELAFWSQPMPLEQLLISAEMIWIQVVSVATRGDTHDVVLETTFSNFAAAPRRRVRLSAKCIDPRLLREGSEWLAPLSINQATQSDYTERAGAFLVPGWLFPVESGVSLRDDAFESSLR